MDPRQKHSESSFDLESSMSILLTVSPRKTLELAEWEWIRLLGVAVAFGWHPGPEFPVALFGPGSDKLWSTESFAAVVPQEDAEGIADALDSARCTVRGVKCTKRGCYDPAPRLIKLGLVASRSKGANSLISAAQFFELELEDEMNSLIDFFLKGPLAIRHYVRSRVKETARVA